MPQEVVLKQAASQWIASIREVIANYQAVGGLYPRVIAGLPSDAMPPGISFAMWHSPEFTKSDVDAEAGFYLNTKVSPKGEVQVRELPQETVASTIHNGSYQRLSESYDVLLRWVSENGYEIAGPIRELYLHNTMPVRPDDESYVTEIQAPVRKPESR